MKKLGTKGFTAVEGLLIIILAVLIVGAGWVVAKQQSGTKEPTTETVVTYKKSDKIAANCGVGDEKDWKVVTSRKNYFSICVPDKGWTIYNESNGSLATLNPYDYASVKETTITNQDTPGKDGTGDIFYVLKVDNFYQGWTDSKAIKSEFELNNGIKGTKYYQKYNDLTAKEKEGLGAPVEGEEAYEYQFKSKSGALYQVEYVVLPPHKNVVDFVIEPAIKTLQLQ